MPPSEVAVGDVLYLVVESSDGIEVAKRTVSKVTPKNFTLDRPFPFQMPQAYYDRKTIGWRFGRSPHEAVKSFREKYQRELDNAESRVRRCNEAVTWAITWEHNEGEQR